MRTDAKTGRRTQRRARACTGSPYRPAGRGEARTSRPSASLRSGFDDDALARGDAGRDLDGVAVAVSERDDALGDAVLPEDEDVRDARVGHDGRRRDEERGLLLRELDARGHEEAGLQQMPGVRDDRLDDERAGLAAERRADVADDSVERAVREGLDVQAGLLADLDRLHGSLGDRELGAQRVDLHEAADRLPAAHVSAGRDLLLGHDAGERRADRAVLEALLGEREGGGGQVEVRALALVLGLRDDLPLAQLGVALDLGLRPREVRAGLVELRLRLPVVEGREDRRPSRRTSRARRGRWRPGRPARPRRRRIRRPRARP